MKKKKVNHLNKFKYSNISVSLIRIYVEYRNDFILSERLVKRKVFKKCLLFREKHLSFKRDSEFSLLLKPVPRGNIVLCQL